MTTLILYLMATTALITCLIFIPLMLVTAIPLQAVYYHSRVRKPIVWLILVGSIMWQLWLYSTTGIFQWTYLIPLGLMVLAIIITYKLYPSVTFPAVDYPKMSDAPLDLPIKDDAEMAIIEHEGITKAYPVDYLIHGHIINDTFEDQLISLTYCALCRSIIPFDVTDIGPLYVGAMKNGNMVLADRKTQTFFQQGSFESVVGPLHPKTLEMIPFQFLTWKQVKELDVMPKVCHVTLSDFREFQLPIPGVWKKLTSGELTPGLSASKRDKSFPARTYVIGVNDQSIAPQVVYIKSEVIERGVVKNEEHEFFLIAQDGVVNAIKARVNGQPIDLTIGQDGNLKDQSSGVIWDIRGKYKNGVVESDLEPLTISDEFWYSWKLFHPRSELIRL